MPLFGNPLVSMPSAKLREINRRWKNSEFINNLDPTFGYTNIGGTNSTFPIGYKGGGRHELTENGYVTKITVYSKAVSGTVSAKCAIYSDSAGAPNALLGTTEEVTGIDTTPAWRDFAFASPLFLSAAYYWLVSMASNDITVYYDTGYTNQGAYNANAYGTFSNPFGTPTYTTSKSSIYATYTPVVPQVRRLKTRGGDARSRLIFGPSLKL